MVTQTGGRRRKKRTGKKRRANTAFLKAGNNWRAHVKKTMAENPNMKFGKELLKLASKTYKKGSTASPAQEQHPKPSKKRSNKKKGKRTNRRKRGGFFGL